MDDQVTKVRRVRRGVSTVKTQTVTNLDHLLPSFATDDTEPAVTRPRVTQHTAIIRRPILVHRRAVWPWWLAIVAIGVAISVLVATNRDVLASQTRPAIEQSPVIEEPSDVSWASPPVIGTKPAPETSMALSEAAPTKAKRAKRVVAKRRAARWNPDSLFLPK